LRTRDDIVVQAELPGVTPEPSEASYASGKSINVDLTNNTLTIQGEKKKDDGA